MQPAKEEMPAEAPSKGLKERLMAVLSKDTASKILKVVKPLCPQRGFLFAVRIILLLCINDRVFHYRKTGSSPWPEG